MKNNSFGKFLHKIHDLIGSTETGAKYAVKIRNQGEAVIRSKFSFGTDPVSNGEQYLIKHVGCHINNYFDVGANVGQWIECSLPYVKNAFGVCFEPSPTSRGVLQSKLASNSTVSVSSNALSDYVGDGTLFESSICSEMSSLVSPDLINTSSTTSVMVSTIDCELVTRNIEQLCFLKIDVEGFDFHVLKGASSSLKDEKIGIIQFEYSGFWRYAGSTLCRALRYLNDFGFDIYLLTPGGLVPAMYEPWGEYYGYANYVAVSHKWREVVKEIVF